MKLAPYLFIAFAVIAVAVGGFRYWSRQPTDLRSAAFRMPIDDAFALTVAGKVVVVGKIVEGEVRPGDRLTIKLQTGDIAVEVEALEAFGEPISVGQSGKNIGVLLVGASKQQISPGAILVR